MVAKFPPACTKQFHFFGKAHFMHRVALKGEALFRRQLADTVIIQNQTLWPPEPIFAVNVGQTALLFSRTYTRRH